MTDIFANARYISVSGGGSRGIACLGVLRALEERGFLAILRRRIEGYVGCSVGALICIVIQLGFTYEEAKRALHPLLYNMDNIAPQKDLTRLIVNYGLDSGENLRNMIRDVLIHAGLAGNITLSAFRKFVQTDLVCVATDLSTGTPVYLTAEEFPTLAVADAVFMSMCVPFLFAPFRHNDRLYVDGGLAMNIPMYYEAPKTLCINLSELNGHCTAIRSWQDYLYAIVACGSNAQLHKARAYLGETLLLQIDPNPESTCVDFNLHVSHIERLMRVGYTAAVRFFDPNVDKAMAQCLQVALWLRMREGTTECDEHECADP